MKTSIISKSSVILTFLLISTCVFAQKETLSFGPLIGGNVARLVGELTPAFKPGLNAGMFLNYSNNSKIGWRAEALYTSLGTGFEQNMDVKKLNYIQVPVMAVAYFNERGNKFRPKIMAGPYLGFLTEALNKGNYNINQDNRYVNTVDVGMKLGAGFNYRLNEKIWLNYDAYYGQGFLDTDPRAEVISKNQAFGMNLGISFPLN